jgi:hypothetical protein
VIDLLSDGDLQHATELLRKNVIPAGNRIQQHIGDLLDYERDASDQSIALAQSDFRKTLALLTVLIVIAVGPGLTISLTVITKLYHASNILFAESALQPSDEAVIILDMKGRILYLDNTALSDNSINESGFPGVHTRAARNIGVAGPVFLF